MVPSAAAVIGTVTVQCRSLSWRVNVSCSATRISTYRSPAGPPPGPTSPCSVSWTRVPVSTPAGILTVRVRRERTRPSPEHSRHGSGMIEPKPRQAAHGRSVRISPRNDRCTWATSPGTAAGLAGDRLAAGRGAVAVAGGAQHGGVDLELAGDAERRLGQLDLDPDQRVLATAYPRSRTATPGGRRARSTAAEERVHDVGEREARTLAEAAGARRTGRRRGRTPPASAGRTAPRRRARPP